MGVTSSIDSLTPVPSAPRRSTHLERFGAAKPLPPKILARATASRINRPPEGEHHFAPDAHWPVNSSGRRSTSRMSTRSRHKIRYDSLKAVLGGQESARNPEDHDTQDFRCALGATLKRTVQTDATQPDYRAPGILVEAR